VLENLSIDVLVAVVDGFKSTTGLDNDNTEDALGRDVHEHVQASFHGGGDHSLTFSNDPNDWVKSPENDGHPSNFVVKRSGFFSVFVDFGVLQEDTDDVDEGDHSEDEEEPLVLVWGLSTSASETNHEHVHDENHSNFVIWGSSKSKDIPKHERRGQNPVDISSPIDR